jgi:hypothetical protein
MKREKRKTSDEKVSLALPTERRKPSKALLSFTSFLCPSFEFLPTLMLHFDVLCNQEEEKEEIKRAFHKPT